MRIGAARLNDEDEGGGRRPMRMPLVLRLLLPRSRDQVAGALAGLGALVILVNALFLQAGPHPAPIFSNKPAPVMAPSLGTVSTLLPHPRPAETRIEVGPSARPRADLVIDIQRALARLGFYDGAPDGVYGPRTDAAIRDFEHAAGLRPSAEPSEALLAAIARSGVKPPAVRRNDPIAALLAPDKRLIAIQRALADFGYGPIEATGVHDAKTRAAIERFERARRRPLTGQVSEQLVRDLAAMTGRPLE
jgi:peptidoglycan hydrolase-like protein with peptidoglycan-binding domain